MAAKTRHLCKWKKDSFDKKFDELKTIVGSPRYACRRCGRAAKGKEWLCKPKSLR